MKKDKEWLKKEINKVTSRIYGADFNTIKETDDLIDQLDEPEVLSQKWVDENVVEGDFRGGQQFWYGRFIEEEKLKNLLVPKQNKPIIPKFVADWIEEERENIIDWHTEIPERFFLILGHKLHYTALANTNISDWVFGGNEEKLYQALKYGYEVEKEKRYYIVDKANNLTLMTFELSDVVGEEIIELVAGYSENETIHFDSKEKAELIARFVGESLEVEEVTE